MFALTLSYRFWHCGLSIEIITNGSRKIERIYEPCLIAKSKLTYLHHYFLNFIQHLLLLLG
jgi:hypothetical protein